MLTHSLIVKIVAKEDRAEDVASFLTGALPLAEAEDFTPVWFAMRADETTFYVVDAFSSAEDRQKHIEGEIAKALFGSADELLAEPPSVSAVDVLAAKTP
ncbi:MAG: antibiotic biosynthesis monooxygenase [Acidobacteriota bacterium]